MMKKNMFVILRQFFVAALAMILIGVGCDTTGTPLQIPPDASVDASPPKQVVLPPSSPTKPTAPVPFTRGIAFTTDSGTTNWVIVPHSYDLTHETPTKLFVWLHGCGGMSQYDVSLVSPGATQDWISLAVGGRERACWQSYTVDGAKVLAAIADLKKHFNVDPTRIVIGGYSSGGDIGYPLMFANADLFAGGLFENTGPSSTALTLAKTAKWKLNITHLHHTGDTTYPIANIRTNMSSLKALGFPVTLVEQPGTHFVNGDTYDTPGSTNGNLRKFLLPSLGLGWRTPTAEAPLCVYTYSAWGECQANNTQTRTVDSSSPNPCTPGPQTLTQSCVWAPPGCVYTYSPWDPCEQGNVQRRTVQSTTPSPCQAGPQVLTQTCVWVPEDTDGDTIPDHLDKCPNVPGVKTTDGTSNGCLPLVVTAKKTYDWGTGYCKQFYFRNPNPVPMSWKQMTIFLKDGKLRGTSSVWSATFPNASATGTIVVTPGTSKVQASSTVSGPGFCADFGTSKFVATNGGMVF